MKWAALLALPVAAAIGLAVHVGISTNELPIETQMYSNFLWGVLAIGLCLIALQQFWRGSRRWIVDTTPVFAGAVVLLCAWEILTTGYRVLRLPYFPSPAGVVFNLVTDRERIWDSAWH